MGHIFYVAFSMFTRPGTTPGSLLKFVGRDGSGGCRRHLPCCRSTIWCQRLHPVVPNLQDDGFIGKSPSLLRDGWSIGKTMKNHPHGNFPIENGVTQVTPFFRQKMLEQSFSLHFPGKVRKVLHDFICKCIWPFSREIRIDKGWKKNKINRTLVRMLPGSFLGNA